MASSTPEQLDQALLAQLQETTKPPQLQTINGIQFRNPDLLALIQTDPYHKNPETLFQLENLLNQHGSLTIPENLAPLNGPENLVAIVHATTGGTNEMVEKIWTRDQTLIALGLLTAWENNPEIYQKYGGQARDILLGLLAINSTPAQLQRFQNILDNSNDPKFLANPANYPQVIRGLDNLNGAKGENWSHKQDAIQMLAWTTVQALQKGLISRADLNESHQRFLGLVAPFLLAINFLQHEDSGSWEEIQAVRTSTMTWNTIALQSLKDLASQNHFQFLQDYYSQYRQSLPQPFNQLSFTDTLNVAIEQGLHKLIHRLPNESPNYSHDDPRYREADAAALIYPLMLGIPQIWANYQYPENSQMQLKVAKDLELLILNQIQTLEDPLTNGISRYPDDSYQGHNFWTYSVAEKLNALYSGATPTGDYSGVDHFLGRRAIVPQGPPAAWTHFNAQLSAWAGERYHKTLDPFYRNLQVHYLNCALGMFTGPNEITIYQDGNQMKLTNIPPFRIPECYVDIDSQRLPSPHTPLFWSVAETINALAMMRKTHQLEQSH